MRLRLIGLLYLLVVQTYAQPVGRPFSFRYDQSPTVSLNGKTLLNPWAGGLNSAQYSTIRLNNDNRYDLLVFDRSTSKISTFLAVDNPTGTGIVWQYAPEYEAIFPPVYSWVLLVDYDADGRKDLFTAGYGGVRVFHNELQNGQLSLQSVADPLITEGFSGRIVLYVATTDIPVITDYDDDGDIDIITFGSDGNLIAYQQNMSVERTGSKGLDFKRSTSTCWGHFQKEFCNDFVFGIQCDEGSGRIGADQPDPARARPMHSGNTLTVVDTDGDGHKDLLFGFVSCENIARLKNTGPNSDKANFISYDSLFPAKYPILFPAFPATFWEDVDGDGQKDLIATPNVSANDNLAYDFQASNWFYKNIGTTQKPDFQLIQKDFLQADMLDLGERAAPALADLDGDGDMDMLVGFGGIGLGSQYRAGIWQFTNQGTKEKPAFVLVTTDYLGITNALTFTNTVPSFSDVDADGSLDLVLTGIGMNRVEIRVLINANSAGAPVQYTLNQAVLWPTPELMYPQDLLTVSDIDHDGKSDLLIGRYQLGTILYYRNAGTAVHPVFELQNQSFGGFSPDDLNNARARSIVITDLNGDQENELLLAADNGTIRVYQMPKPPYNSLTLIDSLPNIGYPGSGLIATIADLDGDALPDLMLGSQGGGLRYLKNTSQKVIVSIQEEPWAFPNPTDRYVKILPPTNGTLDVISLRGQLILGTYEVQASTEFMLDLKSLPTGIYIVRLQTSTHSVLTKKIILHK